MFSCRGNTPYKAARLFLFSSSEMFNESSLFSERADRVPTRFTVETESSMTQFSELSSADLISGKHSR